MARKLTEPLPSSPAFVGIKMIAFAVGKEPRM